MILGGYYVCREATMIFRQLFDKESCTYTYLIASGLGRETLIIDPVKEHTSTYLNLIKELGLKLVISIDTHCHADHVTAGGALHLSTACQCAMGESSKVEGIHLKLKDDESVNIDGMKFRTLHTPGHTDDSYCFQFNDRIFTGDTLLIRGTGRTDFQNGDPYQQYASIQKKLFTLPDDTLVFPAHDYKGQTVSSIGEEKKHNPRLQVNSADEYAEIMNNLSLPYPKKMDIAVPMNLQNGLMAQAS